MKNHDIDVLARALSELQKADDGSVLVLFTDDEHDYEVINEDTISEESWENKDRSYDVLPKGKVEGIDIDVVAEEWILDGKSLI